MTDYKTVVNDCEMLPCSHRIFDGTRRCFVSDKWADERSIHWLRMDQTGELELSRHDLKTDIIWTEKQPHNQRFYIDPCARRSDRLKRPIFERDVLAVTRNLFDTYYTVRETHDGWIAYSHLPGLPPLQSKDFSWAYIIGNTREDGPDKLLRRALDVSLVDRPSFAEQVRRLRKGCKLSQGELAKGSGQRAIVWRAIERGFTAPPKDEVTLQRLGEALRLDPLELPYKNLVAAAVHWRPPACSAHASINTRAVGLETYQRCFAAYEAYRTELAELFAPGVCPI